MEIRERTESIVSLTPAAAAKIRGLMASEEDVSVLRVAIEGGGCSGFQYGLGFDRGAQEGGLLVRLRPLLPGGRR
jgi:iron-sulfur cluster insertion protein